MRAEPWIQPWLAEEELFPGMDWNLEIPKAIRETDAILVCLSKSSITKEGYVQREIKTALDYADEKPEGTVYIIPVRLEECKPPERLSKWQYADYLEGQREEAFERLLTSLKTRADKLDLRIENKTSNRQRFYRRSIHLEYKINADAQIVNNYLLQSYTSISHLIEIENVIYIVEGIQAFNPNIDDVFQFGFVAHGRKEIAVHGYQTIAGAKITPDPIIEPVAEIFVVTINQGQRDVSILSFDTEIKHAHMFTTELVKALNKAFSVRLI